MTDTPTTPGESVGAVPVDPKAEFGKQRLRSLDAYRGLIMIMLAFIGFGLGGMASQQLEVHPESAVWSGIKYQFGHVEWVGCALWDMIQPSFMFMVGVAMAFSYAKRKRLGHSYVRMLGHAMWRSVVLVLLGVFLSSNWSPSTNWSLANVLSQIGLGYTFVFLLWGRGIPTQAIMGVVVLVGTWALFVWYPESGIDIEKGATEVGVESEWAQEHLEGVSPAWHKNANVGHVVDVWLLNLLPREEPFEYQRGGYNTTNFIPSIATMLFGLMCGELLRSNRSAKRKLITLVVAGIAGLVVGQILNLTGVCPIVKRMWTPSWALFSTGWCCLILAALYDVIDVLGYRRWAFPLVVVGMNSIAMYFMFQLLRPWASRTLKIHLGQDLFLKCGEVYEPMLQHTLTGLFLWLICLWMYRQKIFIRI